MVMPALPYSIHRKGIESMRGFASLVVNERV